MLVTYSYQVPMVTRRYSVSSTRQRELGLEPSFDEPVVIHRQSRPVVRASPAPIRRTVAGVSKV